MSESKYKIQLDISPAERVKWEGEEALEKVIPDGHGSYDSDYVDDLLLVRHKRFCKLLNEKIKGEKVSAFGPKGHGLWGGADKEKEFTIKSFSGDYAASFYNVSKPESYRRNNPEVYGSVRVTLEKYSTDRSYGMIYTDDLFEKKMQKIIKELGFKGEISYTEQGMQGTTYVSMSLIYPMDVIAPDLAEICVKLNKEIYKEEQKVAKEAEAKKSKKRALKR